MSRSFQWLCALGFLLAASFLTWKAATIELDLDWEGSFPAGSALVTEYKRYKHHFALRESLVVVLPVEDGSRGEVLEELARLVSALSEIPGVAGCEALTEAFEVGFEAGNLVLTDIVQQFDDYRLALGWREFLAHELFAHRYLSADRTTALITLVLEEGLEQAPAQELRVVAAIQEALGVYRTKNGREAFLVGAAALRFFVKKSQDQDRQRRIPLALLILAVLLLVVFRRPGAVLLGLIVILLSASMTVGLWEVLGYRLNIFGNNVFLLVVVSGTSDLVHFLCFLLSPTAWQAQDREARIDLAAARVFWPCLLTSLTTALGFLALLSSEARIFSEIGLFAALGVSLTFLNTLVIFPVLLHLVPVSLRPRGVLATFPALAYTNWLAAWKKPLVGLSLLLVVPITAGMFDNEFNGDMGRKFVEDHEFTRGMRTLVQRFGFGQTLEVTVAGDERFYQQQRALERLEALENRLREVEGVRAILGYPEWLEYLRHRLGTKADDNAVLRMFERQARYRGGLEAYIQRQERELRLEVLTPVLDLQGQAEVVQRIQQVLEEFRDLTPRVVGFTAFQTGMLEVYRDSMLSSMLLTMAAIALFLAMLIKRPRLAFLGILANIFPLAAVLSLCPLIDLYLDLNMVVVGSVGMGIAVDDTIHFLTHFRSHRTRGEEVRDALVGTFADVGFAMVITTVLFCCAFLVLLDSELFVARHLSLLFVATFVFALLADLVLLPAFLLAFPKVDHTSVVSLQ